MTTLTLNRTLGICPLPDPEAEAQRLRAERATNRRERRARTTTGQIVKFCLDQAEAAHERAAEYSDRQRSAVAAGDHRAASAYYASYGAARITAARWEAQAENPVGMLQADQARWTAQSFYSGRDFSDTVLAREFDHDPDLPEPTEIDEPSRRLIAEVSNARNWAWQPSTEVRITPSVTHTKHEVVYTRTLPDGTPDYRSTKWSKAHTEIVEPPRIAERREYPGQHIIGTSEDKGFPREAIITFWSRQKQQWILVRCWEGAKRGYFTQWLPSEYIPVPSRLPVGEPQPEVDRPSLDAHSDRCIESLDQALLWASRWASQVRTEHAESQPDPIDGAWMGISE